MSIEDLRILVVMPTGGRPKVAKVALEAAWLQFSDDPRVEFYPVSWDGDGYLTWSHSLIALGGSKAECVRLALDVYSDIPDMLVVVDDDVVFEWDMLNAFAKVFEADDGIWMLGAANAESHPVLVQQVKEIAGFRVQVGDGFCTGGGCVAYPKAAITGLQMYPTKRRRNDDHVMTTNVRASGHTAALLLDRRVVLLKDWVAHPDNRRRTIRSEIEDREANGDPVPDWLRAEAAK